jgi:SAM-dependent methyltransferase/8-oxo-dGTP pyrophosphatase MutT (NUDIX family)
MNIQRDQRYAGVLLVDHSGNVILEERRRGKSVVISTFGGTVEEGESDTATALREIREETGAVLDESHLTPLAALPKWKSGRLIHCQYYVYDVPVSVHDLIPLENIRIVRIALEDITRPKLPLTPTARVALELYINSQLRRGGTLDPSRSDRDFTSQYARHRYLTFWEAEQWSAILRTHCMDLRPTQPKRVLDLGTGTGRFLGLLEAVTGAQRTIGVDLSLSMASRAALSEHEIVLANVAALPFGSNSFDVVWASLVWHHVGDSAAACREVYRVLAAARGQLLLRTAFIDVESTGALFDYFPSAHRIQMSRYPEKKSLIQDLEAAGFSDIRHFRLTVPVASTFGEYVHKVRSRAYSILLALSDEEYFQGLSQMEADLVHGRASPVLLPCDLVVATKHSAPYLVN